MMEFCAFMILISVIVFFTSLGITIAGDYFGKWMVGISLLSVIIFSLIAWKKTSSSTDYFDIQEKRILCAKKAEGQDVLIYNAQSGDLSFIFSPETNMVIESAGINEGSKVEIEKDVDWTFVDNVYLYIYGLHGDDIHEYKYLLSPVPKKEEEVVLYKKALLNKSVEKTK